MSIDLNKIYSDKRSGVNVASTFSDPRSEYQKDFDRIIFSSPFRRLQNKTQVFPLPGSVFVHNRLTHSLEVASVGRSFGTLVGDFICKKYVKDLTKQSKEFYKYGLAYVISSACLCHDIGNPAFGHSGEDAIANFFEKNEATLKEKFSEKEWYDFINFEGNANAIRILTQHQNGKSDGGLRLTYSTLASIAKYPCESIAKKKGIIHRKKFGFFQTEKETFKDIALHTSMLQEEKNPIIYKRHPFVWLVEAADDICYNIIDLEDAHRLGIIGHVACVDLLKELIKEIGIDKIESIEINLNNITDNNDQISYLRAKSINSITNKALEIYKSNFEDFLIGNFSKPLYDIIADDSKALKAINNFSRKYVYNHRSVLEIENAGFNVMSELLSHFIEPVLKDKSQRRKSDDKAILLIPTQFLYEGKSDYEKVLGVLDYVSGMTDNYAVELYRRIKGIEIGMKI